MSESYRVLNIRKHVDGRAGSALGPCKCNACVLLPLYDSAEQRLREATGLLEDTVNVIDYNSDYGPGGTLIHRNRVRMFLGKVE